MDDIEYDERDLIMAEKYHEIGHFQHFDVEVLAGKLYTRRTEKKEKHPNQK